MALAVKELRKPLKKLPDPPPPPPEGDMKDIIHMQKGLKYEVRQNTPGTRQRRTVKQ